MKTWIIAALVLSGIMIVLIGSGCGNDKGGGTSPDTTPPATISNLSVTNITESSITLTWKAPGDDGSTGTASAYDIRFATATITNETWDQAISVEVPPTPQMAGSVESCDIRDLSYGTNYYFVIKTVDTSSNWSGLSNVAVATPVTDTGACCENGICSVTFESNCHGHWYGEDVACDPSPCGPLLSNMIQIPAGEYECSEEIPRWVVLSKSFEMFEAEVTNQQFADLAQWAYDHGYCTVTSTSLADALDGSTQELLDLDDDHCEISFIDGNFIVDTEKEIHPVLEVTWYGAAAYCDWLSMQAGLARAYDHSTWSCNDNDPYNADGYRLPTEAEWEYACRAGMQTSFNTGECLDAGTKANYDGNYPYHSCPSGPYAGFTVPVSSFPVNAFDLYDMHGNLLEWCNDWYASYPVELGEVINPVGPDTGFARVLRGGSWHSSEKQCRSAARSNAEPEASFDQGGFRPTRSY